MTAKKTKVKPKTGIIAIAKAAGVSPATVSRFFNQGQVSAKTRAKIEKIVNQTGYVPDSRASSLRKGQTNRIGIIVPDMDNPAYSSTLRVFHDLFHARGYSLVLGCTYGDIEQEQKHLQYMIQDFVDGIILYTCESPNDEHRNQYLKQLLQQKPPVVYVGKQNANFPTDNVTVNNALGIEKAVAYLHRIGKKNIAFLSGTTQNWAYHQRVLAFKQAMKTVKLKVTAKSIISVGQSTIEDGGNLLPKLLDQSPKTDAVICSNDLMAIGAMYAAEKMGIKVPDQLAVVGFDDIQMASLVRPQLTTIRQPIMQIAKQTCEILLARLDGEDIAPRSMFFEPELIVRDSA